MDGSLHDVLLVARREIAERLRSKSFRIGTLVAVAVVAASIIVPAVRGSTHATYRVGVVGVAPGAINAELLTAGAVTGVKVSIVDNLDEHDASRRLRDGKLSLAVVDGERVLLHRALAKDETGRKARFVAALSRTLGFEAALRSEGVGTDAARRVLGAGPIKVEGLEPAAVASTDRTMALFGIMMLFFLLQQYSGWVLYGVVEEKSSRVIEVLLASVRPVRLLAGKVLGIGSTALVQASVIAGATAVLAPTLGRHLELSAAPGTAATMLGWFLIGYLFYCSLYAAAGSLATRVEDVQNLALPLAMPLMATLWTCVPALASGEFPPVLRVLAYLPPTAPMAMPTLVALHAVTWWQAALSAALTVLAAALLMRGAAYVYVRAIGRTRGKIRLREVRSLEAA